MSEEWRENIVEAYVDYRKGKLPSGRTPQRALNNRRDYNQARGESHSNHDFRGPENPDAKKFQDRAERAASVGREMDVHTSFGGKINKLMSPGLGNRSGARPRVAYGEPNTYRHQLARFVRGQASTRN